MVLNTSKIALSIIVSCFSIIAIRSNTVPNDYWNVRARLLSSEENYAFGSDLPFEHGERLANDILMTAKRAELQKAFANESAFPPARNFLEVKSAIEQSKVFQIIKKMPKGAVLHAHDTSIANADWIFWNVTFRDNLYVCEEHGALKLHFFDKPNEECDWKLLSELRKNSSLGAYLNKKIYEQMTMETDNPQDKYPTSYDAWVQFSSIFAFITPFLTYRPVYEAHFHQALEELYADNVRYLELRTGLPPLYELNGTKYSPVETAVFYKKFADSFKKEHPDFLGVRLIYTPSRKVDGKTMDDYLKILQELKEIYPDFVTGFDLAGQEDLGQPLLSFINKLRKFKVDFFFHAGETNWYGSSTDENLFDAILLGTKRIGHGYGLTKHPALMRIVKERKIAIEVNPISNQVLSLVKDLRNHPASQLFGLDFPLVVSNDDPGLWGSRGLSYDFYEAFMGIMSWHADLRALKKLAFNSIYYSSMKEDQKRRALNLWRKQWSTFIQQLTDSL